MYGIQIGAGARRRRRRVAGTVATTVGGKPLVITVERAGQLVDTPATLPLAVQVAKAASQGDVEAIVKVGGNVVASYKKGVPTFTVLSGLGGARGGWGLGSPPSIHRAIAQGEILFARSALETARSSAYTMTLPERVEAAFLAHSQAIETACQARGAGDTALVEQAMNIAKSAANWIRENALRSELRYRVGLDPPHPPDLNGVHRRG